jgi:hypothetical protein
LRAESRELRAERQVPRGEAGEIETNGSPPKTRKLWTENS